MSKIININEATFPAEASSGIVDKSGVVQDASNRGSVKLPAGSPEKTFVGVTTEAVSNANNVTVQTHGIGVIESDGSAVVNPGDWLVLVGTTGRAKAQAIAAVSANVYNLIGQAIGSRQVPAVAGELIEFLISQSVVVAA